jgi:hypothetical protein
MRLYRNGEVPDGASCVACGERRRGLLTQVKLHEAAIVCGNCSLILSKTRPPIGTVAELRLRVVRERRSGDDRRSTWRGGRRGADRIVPRPSFDPTVD